MLYLLWRSFTLLVSLAKTLRIPLGSIEEYRNQAVIKHAYQPPPQKKLTLPVCSLTYIGNLLFGDHKCMKSVFYVMGTNEN